MCLGKGMSLQRSMKLRQMTISDDQLIRLRPPPRRRASTLDKTASSIRVRPTELSAVSAAVPLPGPPIGTWSRPERSAPKGDGGLVAMATTRCGSWAVATIPAQRPSDATSAAVGSPNLLLPPKPSGRACAAYNQAMKIRTRRYGS